MACSERVDHEHAAKARDVPDHGTTHLRLPVRTSVSTVG